ncbi:hypothetical protein JHK82_041316 [Glycine max]|nr:hypothetical protein JHK87_041263 [Glycine soja]KAG4948138.1 hypothetical protein JHK86_041377 [Glycine max]KAG4955603.1 hypothetical protein JHK85_041983 [Glycine max]KAG5104346.1 hypothetical protein JHK82_041316 [Glycine max]KAG5115471.1 hypothetical protein JHK84_041584 [Glycine max]
MGIGNLAHTKDYIHVVQKDSFTRPKIEKNSSIKLSCIIMSLLPKMKFICS